MMIMIDYYDTLSFVQATMFSHSACAGGICAHASIKRKRKTCKKMRCMENNEKVLMFIVSDRKLPSDKILPAKRRRR